MVEEIVPFAEGLVAWMTLAAVSFIVWHVADKHFDASFGLGIEQLEHEEVTGVG